MNTDTEYYKVSMDPRDDGVTIYIGSGLGGQYYTHVNPPNILEKLLGISFASKISKAMKKAHADCDKLNEKREYVLETYNNWV